MKTFTLAVAAVAAFGALAVAPAAQATSSQASTSQATSSHPATSQARTSATTSDAVSLVRPAAFEDDVATPGTHPSFASGECVTGRGYEVCFKRYGDVIWVQGSPGSAVWENWLRNSTGWHKWRTGECVNTHSGWGYCNKDFYEDSSKNALGGHGSGLRLQSCPINTGYCSPQIWIRNNA
ncbi:hypothetical protein [Actinopolymorpha rutila]|uniref:Uncharacterized protein n=1 Tax=Actinopolymorpha rutila TaxID=446787 RepID=A0A852Z544_9ACTN|nr:hypothetical protein [Actinopolymorpha rutila]NYH88084.1 hypothetical protein [Actinopolymorpha rutila]